MTRLPALEPGERVVLLAGAADLDERLRAPAACGGRRRAGALRARRLHPLRLARLLGVVRWPGRVPEAVGFVRAGKLEQRRERARMHVDGAMTVSEPGEG